IRLRIREYFSALLLCIGPKTSVPSGTVIRSLSFRASSRYVFLPKDDVLDPPDCRKGLVSGMEKSVKRLRENRGVLGVRNRIRTARRVGKMAKKLQDQEKEKDQAGVAAVARGSGGRRKDVPSFVSAGTAVGGYVTCWSSW
ncbi:hypothetical protein X777_15627, partial [Ooceraea biroi]